MLLGVISDTHGLLRPNVATIFAGVDLILHAGDVGSRAVLDGLAAIAPVHAVYGNVDDPLDPSLARERTEELVKAIDLDPADGAEAIADALHISAETMYAQAGLLDASKGGGVEEAIYADPYLSSDQKEALVRVYRGFVGESPRSA